jgi:Putative sensor
MTEISIDHASGRLAPIPRPAVMARDFTYLVLGLPLGIAAFTIAVTGFSLAAGLLITLAGIPVLVVTLLAVRALAALERKRAGWVLAAPVRGRERRLTGSPWERTKAIVRDPASWRDALWSLVLLPVGIAGFTVAVSLWSVALGFLTSPAWYWALPSDDETIPLLDSTSLGYSVLRVLIGLAMLPTTAVACRALAAGTGNLARALLH